MTDHLPRRFGHFSRDSLCELTGKFLFPSRENECGNRQSEQESGRRRGKSSPDVAKRSRAERWWLSTKAYLFACGRDAAIIPQRSETALLARLIVPRDRTLRGRASARLALRRTTGRIAPV